MKIQTYQLEVKDSLFNPNQQTKSRKQVAFYRKYPSRSDKTFYKVWIYLDGPDLPFVKRVKYTLHRTFRNPVKLIERSSNNPHCALVIWTWGIFEVKVEVEDMKGRVIRMDHFLCYNEQFDRKDIDWVANPAS
jgi:transcription initiation factor IIF auxiliary subunit